LAETALPFALPPTELSLVEALLLVFTSPLALLLASPVEVLLLALPPAASADWVAMTLVSVSWP
jgi:hypothetical protein